MIKLDEGLKDAIRERLDRLEGPVRLVLFRRGSEGEERELESFLRDVVGLSSRLSLEVYDLESDTIPALQLGIDKAPALVLDGASGDRVRFFGALGGWAVEAFIEALRDAAAGRAALGPELQSRVEKLAAPIKIKVFVSPSCPHCPAAARLAHKLAVESPHITAEVIQVEEFRRLSAVYRIRGVPKVIINDSVQVAGMVNERLMGEAIALAAAGRDSGEIGFDASRLGRLAGGTSDAGGR